MKKLLIIFLPLSFLACFSFGQSLQKGNLFGLHVITVDLKPNVSIEEVKTFYLTKLIPEYQKNIPGSKGYVLNGVRGENKNAFGILWVFESESARAKYMDDEGNATTLGNSAFEKIAPVNKERERFGTFTSKYTDWLIQ